MGNLRELSPYAAEDAAGFVESMRRLKELSGMTYRELEEQAGRNGDVLARSTLADVLRRDRLPRPDVLAAFVRACGDGQRAGDWLEARERIARGGAGQGGGTPTPSASASASAPPSGDEEGVSAVASDGGMPVSGRRRGWTLALAAAVALLLAAGVGVWAWLSPGASDAAKDAPDDTPVAKGERPGPVDGWVTLRPAGDTGLCLTDGRDRRGAYGSAVAVHLPCAAAPVPRTYLEPAGAGLYRIQWHHPELGKGCLTVMTGGPVQGMLEPRDDCAGATLFRPEPVPGQAGAYRFRTVPGAQCVGTADGTVAEGVEAVQEPCADSRDQYVVVRPD